MCKSLLVTFRLKALKYVRMKLDLFPVHRSHVKNSLVQPSFPPFLLFVLVFPTSSSVSFLPLVPPFPLFYFSHSPSPTSHCFLSFSNPLFLFPYLYKWTFSLSAVPFFDTAAHSWCLLKMLFWVTPPLISFSLLPLYVTLKLGEKSGPAGQVLLRGPQHQNHHMAEAHSRVCAQLPAVAEPAEPAAGCHAPVQPALPLPGTSSLTWHTRLNVSQICWI